MGFLAWISKNSNSALCSQSALMLSLILEVVLSCSVFHLCFKISFKNSFIISKVIVVTSFFCCVFIFAITDLIPQVLQSNPCSIAVFLPLHIPSFRHVRRLLSFCSLANATRWTTFVWIISYSISYACNRKF